MRMMTTTTQLFEDAAREALSEALGEAWVALMTDGAAIVTTLEERAQSLDQLSSSSSSSSSSSDVSPVDPVAVAAQHHLSTDDQTALQAALYAAMRTVFLARWAELGRAQTTAPVAALQRLAADARATAQAVARNRNAAVSAFIARFLAWYEKNHLAQKGWNAHLATALNAALADYLTPRILTGAHGLSSMTTGLATSYADLYAGTSSTLYTVDGPPLTDASCAVCRHYYHRTLTAAQAWTLLFPNHPHCDHVIRQQ